MLLNQPELSEQQLRLTLEAAKLGLWEWDLINETIIASSQCEILFGLNPGQFPKSYEGLTRLIHPEDLEILEQKLFSYQSEKEWELNYRVIDPQGNLHFLQTTGRFFYDDQSKKPMKMIALTKAVPPEDLEDSLQANTDNDWEYDVINQKTTWTKELYHIYGFDSSQPPPQGEEICQYIHPDDLEIYFKQIYLPILAGQSFATNLRILNTDGQIRHLEVTGKPIFNHQGQMVRLSGTTHDVTQQQQTTLALQESEKRFYSTFDDAAIGMALVSLEGKFIKINHSFLEITGYSESELLTLTVQEITVPEDWETQAKYTEQLLNNQIRSYQMEKRYIHKAGHLVWILMSCSVVRNHQAQPLYFVIQAQNISEAKYREDERKQAEVKLSQMSLAMENAVEGISFIDPQGRYVKVNQAYAKLLGYQPEDLIGLDWAISIHPEERARMEQCYQKMLKEGRVEAEVKGIRQDSSIFYKQTTMIAVYDQTQTLLGHYCFTKDISDRKKIEENLRSVSQYLQFLLSASPAIIFSRKIEPNYAITYISENVREILGYEAHQFTNDPNFWLNQIHPDDQERVFAKTCYFLEQDQAFCTNEFRFLHANGHYCWLYQEIRLIKDENDQPIEMVGSLIDISEQKAASYEREQAEIQLKNSLQEKEMLLREIHHRVKNNLHVVVNLLDLQSDYVDDEKVLSLFNDSQNRIQSMALIHEQLYQSDNLREVNFQEYLHRLLCNLFSSNETTTKIAANLDIDPIWLNLETAIPCGLLINEFVTNVFKHAFPNRATGEIQLHLTEDEDGWLHFQFSDNGIGLPPDFDWQQTPTLGLKLVRILAKQLKAKVKLESNEGTSFTLIFKQLNYQS